MSRFFVGQRVRLVRPFLVENMGAMGTLTALGTFSQGADCRVDWDEKWDAVKHGEWQADHFTARLAPAYDGNEVVSWESMRELWVPSEVTV